MHKAALEKAILDMLAERDAGKTICPSEVARGLAGEEDRSAWEALMEPVRAAARSLVTKGKLEITQGGKVVRSDTAKGPIRLRLK